MQKYKKRPFVLMGVNTDEPEALAQIVARNHLTWNSWADGQGGPICKQWKIHGFPTVMLIDAQGRIRNMHVDPDQLDSSVEELVVEAEKENAAAGAATISTSP